MKGYELKRELERQREISYYSKDGSEEKLLATLRARDLERIYENIKLEEKK